MAVDSVPYKTWLTGIVLFAVLLQVALVVSSPPISPDGITFCTMARELPNHPIETMRASDQHPGFPALVVLGRFLVLPFVQADSVYSWIWGARLVSGVFGVLVILSAWRLADRTFDRRTAIVTAALVAVLPVFRRNAADALTDSTHLFLYLVAAQLFVEGLERRQRMLFLLAGAASGLAFWMRPEGFSVALVAAAFLPLWAWRTHKVRVASALQFAGVTLAAALLVAAPYMIIIGGFSAKITAKERFYGAAPATAQPDSAARVVPAADAPEETLTDLNDPTPESQGIVMTALRAVWALAGVFAQSLSWVLPAPLLAGAFVRDPNRERVGTHVFLLCLVALHVLLMLALFWAGGYMTERHAMVIAVLAMPRTAAGLLRIAEWIVRKAPAPVLAERRDWVVGGLFVLVAMVAVPRSLFPLHPEERPVVQAALELQVYAKPGDRVASNSPYVPFYAQIPGYVFTRHDVTSANFDIRRLRSPYRFVVFDAHQPPFRAAWLGDISERYEPLTPTGVKEKYVRAFILRPALPINAPPGTGGI